MDWFLRGLEFFVVVIANAVAWVLGKVFGVWFWILDKEWSAVVWVYDWIVWNIWLPTLHFPMCNYMDQPRTGEFGRRYPASPSRTCDDPWSTLALFIGLLILAYVVLWFMTLERRTRKREYALKLKSDAETAIRTAELNARAARERNESEARDERLRQQYQDRQAAEEKALRLMERLPQVERVFVREWGYFRTDKDPLGLQDVNKLRQAFAADFMTKYGVDAPLLYASNNVEVRAIVASAGSTIPRPSFDPVKILGITQE